MGHMSDLRKNVGTMESLDIDLVTQLLQESG